MTNAAAVLMLVGVDGSDDEDTGLANIVVGNAIIVQSLNERMY